MSLDNAQRARVLRRFPESWDEMAEKIYMRWRPFCLAAELMEEDARVPTAAGSAPAVLGRLLELARQHEWNLPVPAEPTAAAADRRFWTIGGDLSLLGAEATVVEVLGQALELARRGTPPVAVLFGSQLVHRVWQGGIRDPGFQSLIGMVKSAGIRLFLGKGEALLLSPPVLEAPAVGVPAVNGLRAARQTTGLGSALVLDPEPPLRFDPLPPPIGSTAADRVIRAYHLLRPEERRGAIWDNEAKGWRPGR